MLPIVDKPIIHYAVQEAVNAGLSEIILVTGPTSQITVDYFRQSPDLDAFLRDSNMAYALDELRSIAKMAHVIAIPSAPWKGMRGLGAAILSARHLVGNDAFAVILPNDLIISQAPCIASLLQIYVSTSAAVVAAHQVSTEAVSTYGNILTTGISQQALEGDAFLPEKVLDVQRVVQRPDASERLSNLAIIGRYVLPPAVIPLLKDGSAGYGGELQLTDALQGLRNAGSPLLAYEFEGEYLDTRTKAGYVRAILEYARRDPEIGSGVIELCNAIAQQHRKA
jgi:UTP--glucose-1-phosphate uridylyltransferase